MPDVNAVSNIVNINVAVDTNNTIAQVLSRINRDNNGIFLPYIQRDFVWNEERIYSLLDSLMRGYPMGNILMWETDKPVNYRLFVENYNSNEINYDFSIGENGHTKEYVLDGQQRLQSLYVAMHGTYDDKALFFYLLSNPQSGYLFEFRDIEAPEGDGWLKVPNFLSQVAPQFATSRLREFEHNNIIPKIRTDDLDDLILNNARRLYSVFNIDHNIPIQKLTNDIQLQDIAKIFVRTNSGGVVLDATDLVMATITSEWTGANQAFNELIPTIQNMGFTNPRAFILQACVAILLGTTVIKPEDFASTKIQQKLSSKFSEISASIQDVLNFINNTLKESGLGDFYTQLNNPILVLIVYRYTRGRDHWDRKQKQYAVRAFFFTALLSKDFRRPTQKLMKELLQYVSNKRNDFSISSIKDIFEKNGKVFKTNPEDLLNIRLDSPMSNLVLYLVYVGQPGFNYETMTIHDHIFPKSRLEHIYNKDQYDSIINCELLSEKDNSEKGDTLPVIYFEALKTQKNKFLGLHAIPPRYNGNIDLWDLNNYVQFLLERKKLMVERIEINLKGLVSPKVPIGTAIKNFLTNLNKVKNI